MARARSHAGRPLPASVKQRDFTLTTKNRGKNEGPDLTTLLKEIVEDSETLLDQQLSLLRAEVHEQLQRAGEAALSLGAGAGLVATGGALSALMVVHALHKATRLPLWACYGLVGGTLGAWGARLLAAGRREAASVRLLPPPRTAAALKENLTWIKEQTTPATT
jgi:hypothetical protein